MSDPKNYTVGWICALSTEQIAAAEFLDAEHESLEDQPLNDTNSYILGSIGKHNVVIAVLPLDQGTASAANVATNLLRTFPNIRVGLLVGIGGGAPSKKHDIRLGDVVVSAPSGGDGGIFQYDFGKTIQEGAFQRTGHLNKPPPVLRSAAATLLTKYRRHGHQFKKDIDGILERNKRLINEFRRPEASSDMLFLPNVVHKEGECAAECVTEDKSGVVSRRKRAEHENDPAIHYGVIASANQVMKDALIRDKLSAEKDVLCFEMEAAGLMDSFPCLVIRGICDYSDSHKNDEWQGFAAMVAAAYAKDLLGLILPSKIEAEQKISEAIAQVRDTVAKIETNVEDIKSHIISQQDLEILNWLADSDYSSQQNDYLARRQQGTGQWLLESKVHQDWLSTSRQTLFCPGIPGAGKTILTAIVIEHLYTHFNSDLTVGIAYNYYNFNRQGQQTADKILASLLRQLCASRSSLPEPLKSLYIKHKDSNGRNTRPSSEEIASTLQVVAQMFSRVFIVIDALDECQNQERSSFFTKIFEIQMKADVNLFATSRPLSEIKNMFQGCHLVGIVANQDDISKYIEGQMPKLPRFARDDNCLKEQIKTEITNIAQGMFLLAQLCLGTLEDMVTPKKMKQALKKFQQISQEQGEDKKFKILGAVYENTMERIKQQKSGHRCLAESALSWLCHAKRQLTTVELQYALAVDIELDGQDSGNVPQEFDDDNIPEIDVIVSSCCGLVTVDEESNIIRLVHYTTQEYFDRMRKQWFPNAEVEIANVCALYLTFSNFESDAFHDEWSYDYELPREPFYGYACMNWGYHAREAEPSSRIVHDFLANTAKVKIAGQAIRCILDKLDRWLYVPGDMITTALGLTAYFGAINWMKKLLPDILNYQLDDAVCDRALQVAVINRQRDTIRLLLDMGADPDFLDGHYGNALIYAARYNDAETAQLLLNNGADPNAMCNAGWTPLTIAADEGNVAVARQLLDMGADVTEEATELGTAAYFAVEHGDKAMIRLLLEKTTYPKQRVYHLKNQLLEAAVWRRGINFIEMVFEKHPWPNMKGRFGSKMLYGALVSGHRDIAELLLQKGAKVLQNGFYGKERIIRFTKMDKEWLAQKVPTLFIDHVG
ncbi:uncharacterized protein TrAFT101_004883 [Trichoderma asperellum]|uniref:uncharacterized protein n=1 Tax=Trichoderma asperellum TaxID=101201 RepID=UPI003331AC20|nr:hypothetical protein TrAFT101_004883 [Trichoderma asperellum]